MKYERYFILKIKNHTVSFAILFLFILTLNPSLFGQNEANGSNEVFSVVDEKPRFPGCEEISDLEKRNSCASNLMLQFIYSNVLYPTEARNHKTEGMVAMKFVVRKDGSITNIEIAKEIGHGCGAEA
ncbi:MAG: energy transducer TonB, partial [Bacteroidota bacterium]